MKRLLKKAVTVLSSAALIGATIGMAAATTYPDPFKTNTVIVYGENAAASDATAASLIKGDLAQYYSNASNRVTGSDSFMLDKSSKHMHLGDNLSSVYSKLDEGEMPKLLAKGKYLDNDNAEFDYQQEITLGDLQFGMFEDDDYKVDTPSLGIDIDDNDFILNYTLDFIDTPDFTDLEQSHMTILGKEYYVLNASLTSNSDKEIILLDSAASATITEGDNTTITVGGKSYTVSAYFISQNGAVLIVNGYRTNKLDEGETQRLPDGSYVAVQEILYSSKDTGTSSVEISIGSGKLKLVHGDEVELNEDSIDNLKAYIQNNSNKELDEITLVWRSDGSQFVTDDSIVTLPGFNSLAIASEGMLFPTEESIVIEAKGDDNLVLSNFPLKDVTETIYLLMSNGTHFTLTGKDSNNKLLTAGPGLTANFTNNVHDYFVLSYKSGDDAESYLVRATNWDDDNNAVDFEYKTDSGWTAADTDVKAGETVTIGNAEFDVINLSTSGKWVQVNASGNNNFHTLYSKEGLEVFLPWFGSASQSGIGYLNSSNPPKIATIPFREEDENDDIGKGDWINVTWKIDSSNGVVVANYSTTNTDATPAEIDDTNVYRDFTYSALATEILDDQSGDHQKVTLNYHGSESYAKVFVTSPGSVTSGGTGLLLIKDTEASNYTGRNMIVVGGSAINSVAAELLGGAYRGPAFTSATGVGKGEFLIQSFDRAGKTALLVAGYEATDTERAVNYLLNPTEPIDTTVGKKYKGVTSTSQVTLVS